MLHAERNKDAGATYTCPTCKRQDPFCRDTRNGPYCRQWGLRYDYSRLQAPAPDPVSVAVSADPAVVRAARERAEARARWEVADAAWRDAAADLRVVETATGDFTFDPAGRPPAVTDAAVFAEEKRPELVAAQAEAWRTRERLAAELREANVAESRAVSAAQLRARGARGLSARERLSRRLFGGVG